MLSPPLPETNRSAQAYPIRPHSVSPAAPSRRVTSLRHVAAAVLLAVLPLVFSGCVSLGGVYGQPRAGGAGGAGETGETGEPGAGSSETEENATEPGDGDAAESTEPGDEEAVISGSPPGDAGERFFRVTEDYWVQTPWFGVSSIIVMVRRTLPPTQIVVPQGSLLANVMQPVNNVVTTLPADHRLDRIRISVSFHMGDVPPFVDPQRYANPEDYW